MERLLASLTRAKMAGKVELSPADAAAAAACEQERAGDRDRDALMAETTAAYQTQPQVVAYGGSGAPIVQRIMAHLGADLRFVESMRAAHNVPMDRLLLLGGADLNPWLYGQVTSRHTHFDHTRDSIEWILVRRAMVSHVPILGICRGHQLLNVAFGGDLHQDIEDDCGVRHPYRPHGVTLKSPLKRNAPAVAVNSLHHQAVNNVAPGFDVVATTPDDIVEGIYRPGVLGVQWHPELLIQQDRRWLKLFSWFVDGALLPHWKP